MNDRTLERQMKAFNEDIKKQFHDDKVAEIDMISGYMKKDAAIKASVTYTEAKRKADEKHLRDIYNGKVDTSMEIKSSFNKNPDSMSKFLKDITKDIDRNVQNEKAFTHAMDKMLDTDRNESIDNLENLIDIEQSKLATAEVAKEKAVDSNNIDEIRAADNTIKEINDRINFYQGQLERVESE